MLGPGPRLIKKRIYRAAVSQRLRNTDICVQSPADQGPAHRTADLCKKCFAVLLGSNGNSNTVFTLSDMYVCVCVCVCIYIYIYTHTHTHTHTHTCSSQYRSAGWLKEIKSWDGSESRVSYVRKPWPISFDISTRPYVHICHLSTHGTDLREI